MMYLNLSTLRMILPSTLSIPRFPSFPYQFPRIRDRVFSECIAMQPNPTSLIGQTGTLCRSDGI